MQTVKKDSKAEHLMDSTAVQYHPGHNWKLILVKSKLCYPVSNARSQVFTQLLGVSNKGLREERSGSHFFLNVSDQLNTVSTQVSSLLTKDKGIDKN